MTELPEEAIQQELLSRIEALDTAIAPYRETMVRLELSIWERIIRRWAGSDVVLPEVPRDVQEATIRMRAASFVAAHWDQHPYRGKLYLPPIMTVGHPSHPLPDMVHILDLDPTLVRKAIVQGRLSERLRTIAPQLNETQPNADDQDLEGLLVDLALGEIHMWKAWAMFQPVAQLVLFECLFKAHYGETLSVAEENADRVNDLFDAFLPDLSKYMTRRPDRLAALRHTFNEIHRKPDRLQSDLASQGPTQAVLSIARDLLGRRLTLRDLHRWHRERKGSRAIALDVLATTLKVKPKTLVDQLSLAEQAQEISETWDRFLTFLSTRPESEQRKLLSAFPSRIAVTSPS